MSDEFGTVSVRRGDRAREIEVLRKHYREHRAALARMAAEAPTDYLAREYARLIRDIDGSMAKLDEIEGRGSPSAASAGAVAGARAGAARASVPPGLEPPHGDPLREETEPGNRPLIVTPEARPGAEDEYEPPVSTAGSRLPLIIIAGLIVLVVIGYLIWHASSEGSRASVPVVETAAPVIPLGDTAGGTLAPAERPPRASAPVAAGLNVVPELADFGTIRKGTRAARQFEITNNTAEAVRIQVARSQCRCLFYEYSDKLAAGKKGTITVTIDAARVKGGSVAESVAVTARGNPKLSTTLHVQASVK